MATKQQELGKFGETMVAKHCVCPGCKKGTTLVRLPNNFRCVDLVCDFCGYLAQVKSVTAEDITSLPKTVRGAGWGPQKERMEAGIYFPLFIVLVTSNLRNFRVYYLSADLQKPEIFQPRKPLEPPAKRTGWTGFNYKLDSVMSAIVPVLTKYYRQKPTT